MSAREVVLFDAKNKKNKSASVTYLTQKRQQKRETKTSVNAAQSEKEVREKLEKFIHHSGVALFKAKAVFPFDLFPNEISIDSNQVNIVIKEFFFSARVHSITIENVMDVYCDLGPFFATLNIIDAAFVDNVVTINYLTRNSATKARRLIQGLMIAKKEDINVSAFPHNELIEILEKLGKVKEISR